MVGGLQTRRFAFGASARCCQPMKKRVRRQHDFFARWKSTLVGRGIAQDGMQTLDIVHILRKLRRVTHISRA